MQNSAFELAESIDKKKVIYKLHQPMWSKYDLAAIDLDIENWTTIKYLNDDCTEFNDDIALLPNDTGGIYMFTIKCPLIPGITIFPVYIGRAKLTDGQNLRKRCREYFKKWYKNNERPKITKMINYWGPELYLSFIKVHENEQIIDFEKYLINSLLLPFNDFIPDKEIRDAVKAFQP